MPTQKLTNDIIVAAIDGFEAQKLRIDSQITELRTMLNGNGRVAASAPLREMPKRRISAAGRKRIAEAQRKRWAAKKTADRSTEPAAAASPRQKRKLSAAGRRAIITASKKRWAAVRAANNAAKSASSKAQ